MWLTSFDAPCLHTMYADKQMSSHNLMQAIARVNRVFKDKPGGLVVDYLGLADQLKHVLVTYTRALARPSFVWVRAEARVPEERATALAFHSAGTWGSKVMERSCSRALAAFFACW